MIVNQFLEENPQHSFTSTYTELYYQPVGWYFADVNMKPWGTVLQNIALKNMEQYIKKDAIIIDDSYYVMSPLEQHNQRTYGYRYRGEAYRPHITLGVTPTGTETFVPESIQNIYKNILYGSAVNFDKAVFYVAGRHGAAEKIVAEIVLS